MVMTALKRYPAIVFLAVAVIAAVVLYLTRPGAAPADNRERARAIDVLVVSKGDHSPSIPVYATVTTPYHAKLRSAVTADVHRLVTLAGTTVSQGDLLVQLDDRESRLIVEQRRAEVREAEAGIAEEINNHENELFVLGDAKTLDENAQRNRKNIIKEHRIRLSRLQASLQKAIAALELAELDLARTRITAPFDGRITKVHVSRGERVQPGNAIIDLYNHQAIELVGPVAPSYLPRIQSALDNDTRLQARAEIDSRPIIAVLDRLSAEVGAGTGTIDLYFRVISGSEALQLGRNVQLQLALPASGNSFAIPLSALYGTDIIYKVVDNRLKPVQVSRLGDYHDGSKSRVLVSSGQVSEGDSVMITQLPNAIENLLVAPRPVNE